MRAKLLPRFVKKNDRTVIRDDDYAVYFPDAGRQRYWLDGFKGHDVHVESLAISVSDNMQTGKFLVSRRLGMESQTVHYKIWQDHIRIDFFNAINDSLHIIDGNTLPLKGNCAHISPFQARELTSQERVFLLRLIVYEFVRRRPSNPVAGITLDEALALLYGRLAIPAALGRE